MSILDIVTGADLPGGGYAFLTDADSTLATHGDSGCLTAEDASTAMRDMEAYFTVLSAFGNVATAQLVPALCSQFGKQHSIQNSMIS